MASSSDHKAIGFVQSNEKYLRLRTLINHACYELYCKLFLDSNYGGFSRQPDIIYRELSQYRESVESLKNKGDISEADFLSVFPPSEETYLRECSLSLLHKLSQVCVKTFPRIIGEGDESGGCMDDRGVVQERNHSYSALDNITYINQLEKLQTIIHDEKLQQRLTNNPQEFEVNWIKIIALLQKLGYDVSKVAVIKSIDNLDSCRLCHVAYMRSQGELLSTECTNLLKTTEVNTLTLSRLISNLKNANSLEGKSKREEENISPLKEMKDLKDSIEISSNMLHVTHDSVQSVFGELKFWKDKNIEGDLIILDESLNKLNVQVSKQSRSVSHYFNTVSFDIVKIKEKINNQMDKNVKFVKPHDNECKDKKISLGFVSIGFN